MFKPDAESLYLCDNGACYCGKHLGVSAATTGRDISGQRIYALQPEDASEGPFKCERCGKAQSRLVLTTR